VTLEAESVTMLAENGGSSNYGLFNDNGAAATLRGGSFAGRGGEDAKGIRNDSSGTTLVAEGVTALGENGGSRNHGLGNYDGAAATLRGGSFTGHGGASPDGIYNHGSGTTLEAESVTALGENGGGGNYGLRNIVSAAATLRGGSFTGRGGTFAYGINNYSSATLEAQCVTALAENASSSNDGLINYAAATVTMHGGSFTGRGGAYARGIYNSGGTLEAKSVTALGEDGSSTNDALYQVGGTVRLGVSQLDGGATRTSGTLTCFRVYDGGYAAYTCP
jgi:hypothetical protein